MELISSLTSPTKKLYSKCSADEYFAICKSILIARIDSKFTKFTIYFRSAKIFILI